MLARFVGSCMYGEHACDVRLERNMHEGSKCRGFQLGKLAVGMRMVLPVHCRMETASGI